MPGALWGLCFTRGVTTEGFPGSVPFPTLLATIQLIGQRGGTGMHMFQYVSLFNAFIFSLFLWPIEDSTGNPAVMGS